LESIFETTLFLKMNTDYWIKANYKDTSNKIHFAREGHFNMLNQFADQIIKQEMRTGKKICDILERTVNRLEDNIKEAVRLKSIGVNISMKEYCLHILVLTKLNVDPEILPYSYYPIKVKERPCNVCGKFTRSKCSNCRVAYYCCSDHQKQDWKECHNVVCSSWACHTIP